MAASFPFPRSSSKRLSLIISSFFLIGFVLGLFALPQSSKEEPSAQKAVEGVQTSVEPTQEKQINTYTTDTDKGPEAIVLKVVDGDTIRVTLDSKEETVRIIGINTPETVDPRRPAECFGKEASDKAKALLTGEIVQLEEDTSQNSRDTFGRLLRFVWLEGGTLDYGKYMIEQGYAHEYTYETPYKYQTTYKKIANDAQAEKRGLWGEVCKIENTVESSSDKDCRDFTTQEDAQTYFLSKGGSKERNVDNLDPDRDGVVCESLR